MSMVAINRGDVERARFERRRAREEMVVRVIKDRYVVERIMRLVRKKAMASDEWQVRIPLTWRARLTLRADGLADFTRRYIEAELEKRGFDIPMQLIVMSHDFLSYPSRVAILVNNPVK